MMRDCLRECLVCPYVSEINLFVLSWRVFKTLGMKNHVILFLCLLLAAACGKKPHIPDPGDVDEGGAGVSVKATGVVPRGDLAAELALVDEVRAELVPLPESIRQSFAETARVPFSAAANAPLPESAHIPFSAAANASLAEIARTSFSDGGFMLKLGAAPAESMLCDVAAIWSGDLRFSPNADARQSSALVFRAYSQGRAMGTFHRIDPTQTDYSEIFYYYTDRAVAVTGTKTDPWGTFRDVIDLQFAEGWTPVHFYDRYNAADQIRESHITTRIPATTAWEYRNGN